MAKTDLTASRLRSMLHYSPDTGLLWRRLKTRSRLIDTPHNGGYIQVGVDGHNYLAHRLIWLWVHGVWPEHDIDHINGVRDDNRLANLRAVTRAVNLQNRRGPGSQNTSGFLGVNMKRKRWRAQISVDGKTRLVGYYATPEEAHEAYITAKRSLHPGCTI